MFGPHVAGCTRSRSLAFFLSMAVFVAPGLAQSIAGWHTDLSKDGGGYWPMRVAVHAQRTGLERGVETVHLTVGGRVGQIPIQGMPVHSIRVCDEAGLEYLYAYSRSANHVDPALIEPGDGLDLPVVFSSDPTGELRLYVYVGNPMAGMVDKYWGFVNGNFEEVAFERPGFHGRPLAWSLYGRSTNQQLEYRAGEGMNGTRCVNMTSQGSICPPWFAWYQNPIPVHSGDQFELSAYVRGEPAGPTIGCFVHFLRANGEISDQNWDAITTAQTGWTRVVSTFTVPPDTSITHLAIGTSLCNGEGTAWYDDITLTPLNPYIPNVWLDAPEYRTLTPELGDEAWSPGSSGDWRVRAEVRAFDFLPGAAEGEDAATGDGDDDAGIPSRLVVADMREAVQRVRSLATGIEIPQAVVVDAVSGGICRSWWVNYWIVFESRQRSNTEHRFYVYLAPAAGPTPRDSYAGLMDSGHNLARDPSFEEHPNPPAWNFVGQMGNCIPPDPTDQSHEPTVCGWILPEGMHGPGLWCARCDVSANAPIGWRGLVQQGVPARPQGTYFYAGNQKAARMDAVHGLYGHYVEPNNQFVGFGTYGSIHRDHDWELFAGTSVAPSDVLSVELHLTMNTRGTLWHDAVFFAEALHGATRAVQWRPDLLPSEDVCVWVVNPLVKVVPEMLPPSDGQAPQAVISAAGREREPFQVALWSRRAVDGVRVTATPLRMGGGPAAPEIDPPEAFAVATVPVDRASQYFGVDGPEINMPYVRLVPRGDGSSDGWGGRWPDPLYPLVTAGHAARSWPVAADETTAFWFRVSVPADATPGVYTGTVTLWDPAGFINVTVPVELTVRRFSLPATPNLEVIFDANTGWNQIGSPTDPNQLAVWYQFMSEYRISPGMVFPRPKFYVGKTPADIRMDAADFDSMAARWFNEWHFSTAYTPGLFYALWWNVPPPAIQFDNNISYAFGSPEYDTSYTAAMQVFTDHLMALGGDVHRKFTVYASDEPRGFESETATKLQRVCNLARNVSAPLPVYASTWEHFPLLDGYLTHQGPGPYGNYTLDDMHTRLQAGDKLWFTTDGQIVIDTPYLAIERLLPTLAFRCRWDDSDPSGELIHHGVSGYEYWGIACCGPWDPWERGDLDFGLSFADNKWVAVRFPNGDGYLAYPGATIDYDRPLPSIRLEAVRDGVDDYDYYMILERLIDERCGGDAPDVCVIARAARDEAKYLVEIPNAGGNVSTKLMPNPDAVQQARRDVAHAIELLLPPGER